MSEPESFILTSHPCFSRPCEAPVRWEVVDLMGKVTIKSCDKHTSHAVHRRMRQIGRGAQVVLRPLFALTDVTDCAVMLAVSGDIATIVGKEGVPRLVAESSTTDFAAFVTALGGTIHEVA